MLKRLLILLTLCPLAHSQELISPPLSQYSITIFVCRPYRETEECRKKLSDWQRLKDESDLNAAILADFMDAKQHKINPSTRKRIIELAKRLVKNKYD